MGGIFFFSYLEERIHWEFRRIRLADRFHSDIRHVHQPQVISLCETKCCAFKRSAPAYVVNRIAWNSAWCTQVLRLHEACILRCSNKRKSNLCIGNGHGPKEFETSTLIPWHYIDCCWVSGIRAKTDSTFINYSFSSSVKNQLNHNPTNLYITLKVSQPLFFLLWPSHSIFQGMEVLVVHIFCTSFNSFWK